MLPTTRARLVVQKAFRLQDPGAYDDVVYEDADFGPGPSESLFTSQVPGTADATDGQAYEMGMKFQAAVAGDITHVRYWRAVSDAGPHTGRIWSAAGAALASVAFTGETASGWQQMALAAPLPIAADTTYVVTVNVTSYYAVTNSGLATSLVNGNISSVDDGQNGVFGQPPGVFPTGSFNEGNYFRDIVFAATVGGTAPGGFSAGFDGGFQ